MRLTAIRLAGFKSFVDRTELRLSSNLTAIVGPNGCGKSNLIDAVRWVLGESSARQLRGTSLEDVIFTGSRTRKPVGRASIELVFDNSDNTLSGQWGAYTEIAVRRELSRDGQSLFFINGQRCRRKDVTELFLGTGLGPRANYAIIEQGTISRLVEAQPDDLRQMLEEAAGVSRYKEKRRETETRIRHTRENLERLQDLIGELDERLAKLKRQVSAAERYKALRAEQRTLRAAHFGLRWQQAQAQCATADEGLREREAAAELSRRALTEAMAALNTAETAQSEAAATGRAADERYYAAQADLARVEQELAHQQQMRNVREGELEELRAEAQRLEQRLQQAREEHVAADAELGDVDAQLQTLLAGEADAEARQNDTAAALDAAQTALLEARRATEEPRTAQAREQARREQIARQHEALSRRLQGLEQQAQALRERPPAADLPALQAQQAEAARAQQAGAEAAEAAGAQLQQAREAEQQAEQQARADGATLDEARARLNVLRAEQERSLHRDQDDLNEALQAQGLQPRGRLGAVLRVPEGREAAIEAVLGDWLRAVLLDGRPEAAPAGALLLSGAVGRIDVSEESLAWGVEAPPATLETLRPLRYCADWAQALEHSRSHDAGCVTAAGERLWPQALQRPQSEAAEGGILRRQKALEAAQSRFDASEQQAARSAQQRSDARAALQAAEQAWAEAGRALDQQRRARSEVEAALSRAQAEHERHRRQLEDTSAALNAAREEHAEIEAEQAQVARRVEEAGATLSTVLAAAEAAEARWREAQQARGGAEQQAQGLRRDLGRLRGQREELLRRRSAAESGVASQTHGLEQIRTSIARAEQALVALPQGEAVRERHAQAQQAFATQTQARDGVRAALDAANARRAEAQRALDAARQANERDLGAVQEARLERERLSSRLEALREQLEEQGLSPQRALESIAEGQQLAQVHEALEEIERKLARLGAVNLAAVEEYQEESARAEDLKAQHADLSSALEQLEDAMAQIDRETRALFRSTYNEVNQRFQARFPRLFGGGEAGLELLGDDVLSAGVRVMARPPGKRNASIALLSGGEKALTAVALVFALFELNPAPFCMLDEVDAPLDDANVVRFCDVVREMSAQVQFIVVTHNKVTMEMADALHGVTMQEAGVSRLVGVDVSAAVAMTEEPA